MQIKNIKLKKFSNNLSECPEDTSNIPEYAFVGRSNVGKSSLINFITKTTLAKISKTPGKTRSIIHFIANEYSPSATYFVDLPGYGYAKVAKDKRLEWGSTITEYLLHRRSLARIFVLIDASIPPQDIDMRFLLWLISEDRIFNIVFTKIDKISTQQKNQNIQEFKSMLDQNILANFDQAKLNNVKEFLKYFEISVIKNIGAFAVIDSI
jgi:GTP-binding protein